jgi:hypothetical protein
MELPWLLLKRLIGINPATPLDSQEGQLRYTREGAVDGKLELARQLSGGSFEWAILTDGAPDDATYITQTPNATLTAEQALSLLASGIMVSTTATGVVLTRLLAVSSPSGGIAIANASGIAGNPKAASTAPSGLTVTSRVRIRQTGRPPPSSTTPYAPATGNGSPSAS